MQKLSGTIRGQHSSYVITTPISAKGAHGVSYLADRQTSQAKKTFFVKFANLENFKSPAGIKDRLKRISESFLNEYDHRLRLKDVPNIAHVEDWGTEDSLIEGLELPTPFLVQEYIEPGITLDMYLMQHNCKEQQLFCGLLSTELWFNLAKSLATIILEIHSREVVHGDIWPPNILMQGQQPVLIDFGQSFIRDIQQFDSVKAYFDHAYLAPERRKNAFKARPWEAPSDIFSLGMLLLYCATGQTLSPEKSAVLSSIQLRNSLTWKFEQFNPTFLSDNMCI